MIELTQESYTKTEVQGLLQSECDKIRTEYSKKLKTAQDKVAELTPPTKSESELALEAKAAELSKRERVLACREAGLAPELADLFRDDVDLSKLPELFGTMQGYVPGGHKKDGGLTREQFQSMSYSEQAELYAKNPNIIESFI